MMTFDRHQIAEWMGARSRSDWTAQQALQALDNARICSGPGNGRRLQTPRALCESIAARAGLRLSSLSAHQLADVLRGAT